MSLTTWLTQGDQLYKQQHVYEALREWEGAFTRAFQAVSTASDYQEIASELVMRLYWLQRDKRSRDMKQFLKNSLKSLQKMQKNENIRSRFFLALLQQFTQDKYYQLFFLNSKSLLSFFLQHVKVLEGKSNEINGIIESMCQKTDALVLTSAIEHEDVVHAFRVILLGLFIKTRVDGSVDQPLLDACQKNVDRVVISEKGKIDEKIHILVESTVFLSLLDPTSSLIRKNLALLKNLVQEHKNLGSRQQLKEARESLIALVQALRQEEETNYFEKKRQLLRLLGTKNSLLPMFFKEIEKNHGFKQGLPFSLF